MSRRLIAAACAIVVSLITQQRAGFAADTDRQYLRTLPVQALIVPVPGGIGTTVILEAAGFAPLETVTFRIGLADPFSGGITNPVLTVAGVSDAFGRLGDSWGSVPVPPQT